MTSSAHRVSRLLAIRQRGVWSHAKVEGFPKPLDNGRPTHGETNGRATVPRPPRSHEASSGAIKRATGAKSESTSIFPCGHRE